MTFIELMAQLEAQLGNHQIPLNSKATDLRDLFESGPLHHDLINRVVREIYRRNRCRHLRNTVTRDDTFNALSPIRQSLLKNTTTDVDAYHVMDDLCRAIAHAFSVIDGGPGRPRRAGRRPDAQVIDITPFLRARRIRSWAG
jgi:hypothetical protein